MSAKKDEPHVRAYKLGLTAGFLILERPEGWKRKLSGNIRAARNLGVKIEKDAFNDLLK